MLHYLCFLKVNCARNRDVSSIDKYGRFHRSFGNKSHLGGIIYRASLREPSSPDVENMKQLIETILEAASLDSGRENPVLWQQAKHADFCPVAQVTRIDHLWKRAILRV